MVFWWCFFEIEMKIGTSTAGMGWIDLYCETFHSSNPFLGGEIHVSRVRERERVRDVESR